MNSRAAQLPFDKNTRESSIHYRDLDLTGFPVEVESPATFTNDTRGISRTTFAATTGLGSSQRGDAVAVASHSVERDARTGPSNAPIKQPATLSRQTLRALGFNEIRRQCRLKFPRYTRREINQLARELHERAWKSRDREAVARVMYG